MSGHLQGVQEEADWTALPDDIIQKIAAIFCPTDDLDYYIAFRQVCSPWRRATRAPEFRHTKWINLEHSLSDMDDCSITFLNLITGRCLRKKITRARRR